MQLKVNKIPLKIDNELIDLSFRDWGDSANERKLICLHGNTRNSRDFNYLASVMSEHYNVICPDMPGRGLSGYFENIANYSLPSYLHAINELISKVTLDTDAIYLLGTSLGALISMHIAAQKNFPVKKLLINDFGPSISRSVMNDINPHQKKITNFQSVSEAVEYHKEYRNSFGPMDDALWVFFTQNGIKCDDDGDGFCFDYDTRVNGSYSDSIYFDLNLWHIWEAISCQVLLLRGEVSKVLKKRLL